MPSWWGPVALNSLLPSLPRSDGELLPIFHKQNENQIKHPVGGCRGTASRPRGVGRAESGAVRLAGRHTPLTVALPSEHKRFFCLWFFVELFLT